MFWNRATGIMVSFAVYSTRDVKFYAHSSMKSEMFFFSYSFSFFFFNWILVEYKGNGPHGGQTLMLTLD